MKRSEMLKIMYAASLKNIPYNDDGGIQLYFMMENILEAMEQKGMLPPSHEVKPTENSSTYTIYDWEFED